MRKRKRTAETGEVTGRLLELETAKHSHLSKDSIVEVTSKISGYVGSWYQVKVLRGPRLPKSKFKRKRKMLVEYIDLLNNDGTRPLREFVDAGLVRPVPPTIVAAEEEAGEMVFEVGEEVDTYDRDGWWTGVVDRTVRRKTEDGKDVVIFVVRFKVPEHEIEFRGKDLRLHVDWYDGKWFVSRDSKSQELLVPSDGRVSLASIRYSFKETAKTDGPVVLRSSANSFPAMESLDGRSSLSSQTTSPHLPMKYLHEVIDRGYPCSISPLAKKIERTCVTEPSDPVSGTSVESTSELRDAEPLCLRPPLRLTYNDVNPLRECGNKEVDGSIAGTSSGKDNANNPAKCRNTRRKSSKPTRIILSTGEDGNAGDVSKYTSMEEWSIAAVGTELTYKEQDELQNPESVHRNSSMEETSNVACRNGTELNHIEQGHSHFVENGGMNPETEAVGGEQPAGDGVTEVGQSFPFVKISPIWQAVESLEVLRRFPQNPHFRPLLEEREGVREGLAIAKMVTYASTADNVLKLSIDDPPQRFTDCSETLHSLELHGFDTRPIESRLTRLLALKDERQKIEQEKTAAENQISVLMLEKAGISKDIGEIVEKIRLYQEKLASVLSIEEEKDRKLSALRTSLDTMEEDENSTRINFEELTRSW